jgi:ribonuclease BN (tRNA processing enzyme)
MSEVVFVGTSDAFGAGGRRQSAVFVRGRRGALLLDCGATTNTGLEAEGIQRDEIDAIVVSHFHGDHFGGIPLFLLGSLYEDRRTRPLHIAGPPDIEARVHALADAMGHGIRERDWSFEIRFSEVPPGTTHQLGPAEVRSFETHHQIESHPHGYQVSLGEQRIVYSGDTGWFDGLPALAAGADLFICECTNHTAQLDFHLNLEQLVERKPLFDCGHMLLTHLGSEMAHLRGEIEFDTADDGLHLKL